MFMTGRYKCGKKHWEQNPCHRRRTFQKDGGGAVIKVVIVKAVGTGLQKDHLGLVVKLLGLIFDFLLVYFQKYEPNPAA